MERLYFDSIKNHTSSDFNNYKVDSKYHIRKHPIEEILFALKNPNNSKSIYQYAMKTAKAIYCISEDERYNLWFKQKWKEAEKRVDSNRKAVSVLAEYRAFYYLLSSRGKIVPIHDNEKIESKDNNCSPDFKLIMDNGDKIYFEVFTPLMKSSVEKELESFFNNDTNHNKKITVKTIAYNPIYGEERDEVKRTNKIKQRILSNKYDAHQACPNSVNILWIDLIAHEWNCSKSLTKPYFVKNSLQETFIGSFGIWNAFYGDPQTKLIKDRTSIRYISKNDFASQTFNGYFYENNKWSGVILAFSDGIVFYENPFANYHILKHQIKYLLSIEEFDFSLSWINIHDGYLLSKIQNTKKEIEYMYNLNDN